MNDAEKLLNYFKIAVNIYSTIENKVITKEINVNGPLSNPKPYTFTQVDKKALSLFLAGFLIEGSVLSDILRSEKDLKIQDVLEFMDLRDVNEVKKISKKEYEECFDKNFVRYLMNMLNNLSERYEVKGVNPETIFQCFEAKEINGSHILNYFSQKYLKNRTYFYTHPMFTALTSWNLSWCGHLIKKVKKPQDKPNFNKQTIIDKMPSFNIDDKIKIDSLNYIKKDNIKGDYEYISNESQHKEIPNKSPRVLTAKDLGLEPTKSKPTTSQEIDYNDESVWAILDDIKRKFIGQETAAEELFYNIINNQQLAQNEAIPDGQRSLIFMDGPTGTGKTAITREITKKLDIPFVATSITSYSAAGYVGGNITDILKELYNKANGDLKKAERGIVVLDEFEKIAYNPETNLEMKLAVQNQLLDFLGGGKYKVRIGTGLLDTREIEFDTSKLTFVCLGALTNLRKKKTEKKRTIGFGSITPEKNDEPQEYSITSEDLINIGLERELVGRINTYLHTKEYRREDYINILKNSQISPLLSFKTWVELKGKKLEVPEETYNVIADYAYKMNTGARSLQTIMNSIRTHFLKEVLRGTNKVINLEPSIIRKILDESTSRRARG